MKGRETEGQLYRDGKWYTAVGFLPSGSLFTSSTMTDGTTKQLDTHAHIITTRPMARVATSCSNVFSKEEILEWTCRPPHAHLAHILLWPQRHINDYLSHQACKSDRIPLVCCIFYFEWLGTYKVLRCGPLCSAKIGKRLGGGVRGRSRSGSIQ